MNFTPSRRFRREYDKVFRRDPGAANILLLLAELADEKGQVSLGPCPEADIQKLMGVRFDDPFAYQLSRSGGPRR